MAKYKVQIQVQSSSVGYAAVEVPPYDSGATAAKNEWRPWYDYYTFRPIEYADSSRFQILPFIKWAIQITPNEFVTAEMLSDITGGRTSIESSSPSFSPFNNVDKEYDANGMPVLSVRATVYFATGDPTVDPPPANKKRVTVTVTNGTPPDSESHTASGTVTVNGNTSETTATATGLVSSDGTDEFSYSVSATPAANYAFDRWNDGDTSPSKSGSTRTGASFTAYFKKRHTVTVLQSINVSYVNGDYTGLHDEGDRVTIYFSEDQGSTPVIFRAAKKDGNNETLLWNADGQTTKTFTMPDADVVVVIGCFYDKVSVTPVIYTNGSIGSSGGSTSPGSASGKENGQSVSFIAQPSTGHEAGKNPEDDRVWDWDAAIFDTGGNAERTGTSSSVSIKGDAQSSTMLAGMAQWTGLNAMAAKWFMQGSYSSPKVYFYSDYEYYIIVEGIAHSYSSETEFWFPNVNRSFVGGCEYVFSNWALYPRDMREDEVVIYPVYHDVYRRYMVVKYRVRVYNITTGGGMISDSGIVVCNRTADPSGQSSYRIDLRSLAVQVNYRVVVDVWVWVSSTGEILFSQSNGGEILFGDDGSPMAKFIS